MFQLSPEDILRNTTNMTFKAGSEFLKGRRIKSIQFNQERLTFDAVVLGTRHYDIHMRFDSSGVLQEASCTCSGIEKCRGYCEHIVAVLLLIHEKDAQGFFRELKFRQAAKHVFNFFQSKPSVQRTPVELEVTYELGRGIPGRALYSALSLRIGTDKLYVVRNIKKFFESIDNNEEIVFGKKFSFDPLRNDFRDEDRPLVNFLREFYETEKLLDELSYGTSRSTIFRDKQLCMTSSGVRRFFELYTGRSFKAVIQGRVFDEMRIRQGDFPVDFTLTKEGSDLLLSIDFDGQLIPLDDDGEYFFAADSIYRVSKNQKESFKPFYLTMMYQKGRKLRFIEEDKERFVSEILPFAERAGRLSISENVQSLIEKVPLEAEIYLDRSGSDITAEVRFVYGERTINPFAPSDRPVSIPEKILLRDVGKECIILDILAESDFKVKNNRIYLNGDDSIFDFVFNTIPSLQEHANIFYSESFRNLTVRNAHAFAGRIRLNTGTDMLEFSFDLDGIDRSELADIFNSLRQKKRFYKLRNGSYLNLDSQELKRVAGFMEYLDLDDGDFEKECIEIPKYRALYLDQCIRESGFSGLERNHAFKELVQNIREPSDMEFEIPEGITGTLREYQKFGFKWLKALSSYGMGGVLADDMGLGKTLQVLALILSEKLERGPHPSLVVVPTSLVYNWCAEIDKFAPGLRYAVVAGSRDERQKQMGCIMDADLVITSYPLIRRDIDDYRDCCFRYCILDEAQHIKNPGSQNAHAVKEIRAERRFALTGTPMENNLTELWSIYDFVLPGYLFSHNRFVQKYESPVVKSEDRGALEDLGRQIRPFLLRRLKTDVLTELPEKIEHRVVAELTEEQKKIYLAYLEQLRNEITGEIREKGFERSHIKILAALTRLRQICCHPSLFLDDYSGESGKLFLFQEIISDSVESGHRVLVFSQYTGMLQVIREWLEGEGLEYLYLDGSTKTLDRGNLVKSFNEGQGKVFLISLKAGGTGLNLTGADTVIHYDPWWNPAVEDQATDRAYRIGQKQTVHVMKLVTKGTIEEKIHDLQEKKKALIDAVIQPGETLISKLTEEEIRSLFE